MTHIIARSSPDNPPRLFGPRFADKDTECTQLAWLRSQHQKSHPRALLSSLVLHVCSCSSTAPPGISRHKTPGCLMTLFPHKVPISPMAQVRKPWPSLFTCTAEGGHGLQNSSLEIKRPGPGSVPQHGELSGNVVHGKRELRVLPKSRGGRTGGTSGSVPSALPNL